MRSKVALVAIALLGFGLVGCGSDDSDSYESENIGIAPTHQVIELPKVKKNRTIVVVDLPNNVTCAVLDGYGESAGIDCWGGEKVAEREE